MAESAMKAEECVARNARSKQWRDERKEEGVAAWDQLPPRGRSVSRSFFDRGVGSSILEFSACLQVAVRGGKWR